MTDSSVSLIECVIPARELEIILLCAFRYSLGRMTYITSSCAEWLRKYWHIMPLHLRAQIHDDINSAISRGYAGHDCDVEAWRSVLSLPLIEVKATEPLIGK